MRHLADGGWVSIATDDNERVFMLDIVQDSLNLSFFERLILFLGHRTVCIGLHAATCSANDNIAIKVLTTVTYTIEEEGVDMSLVLIASSLGLLEVRQRFDTAIS